jgi:hypothetical protein
MLLKDDLLELYCPNSNNKRMLLKDDLLEAIGYCPYSYNKRMLLKDDLLEAILPLQLQQEDVTER